MKSSAPASLRSNGTSEITRGRAEDESRRAEIKKALLDGSSEARYAAQYISSFANRDSSGTTVAFEVLNLIDIAVPGDWQMYQSTEDDSSGRALYAMSTVLEAVDPSLAPGGIADFDAEVMVHLYDLDPELATSVDKILADQAAG